MKGFWDIPSADIQVRRDARHVLLDAAATYQTYSAARLAERDGCGDTQDVRDALARVDDDERRQLRVLDLQRRLVPAPRTRHPDKIVMGDGILEGYTALGFGDVAPQAIFAHEFAHQIQYENGYFDDSVRRSSVRRSRPATPS